MHITARIAPIPVASDIETQRKSRFTHLYLTLLPQVTGRRNRRRLASPLHGTFTPGRISVGRPPSGRTGVSLSLTESSQNSLPSAVSRSGGNRWAPYILAALIGAAGKRIPPFLSPCSYRWSWRTLRCCLPLSSRGPVSNVSMSPDIRLSMYTEMLEEPVEGVELEDDRVQYNQILTTEQTADTLQKFFLLRRQCLGVGMEPVCQVHAAASACACPNRISE